MMLIVDHFYAEGRGEGGVYNVHSARGQKSYTNKIVRNQFGVKFPLSTVVKSHTDSNIPIVITSPFDRCGPPPSILQKPFFTSGITH